MRTRVEELFHELADLPRDARSEYFERLGVDGTTRSEVEALLAFDLPTTSSLDRDIGRVAKRALAQLDPRHLRCGPYRLGETLGRGGMGTVYAAERVDGELSHRVAVKLLRPGVDDIRLRARFLAERQILAALSHPNIARLLDAGHREDGQPYLVMEYVEGKPIDAYASSLSARQKVALFLKVCAAVAYLHRNLVVHRDLKPPNILVTSEGEPKLLDFGIAKMLDLTADSTITAMRMLTPEYASPEQVAGGRVTTATDIYSLGAVLYKLLTGYSAHAPENNSFEAICSGRITPPSKIVPALRGDLEVILMKTLRKEPQERYATIEQLSEDLEGYLESRPIRARRGETFYRARKFLRRFWLPVTAVTLAVASLSTGLALANRERTIAQRRYNDLRQLANKMFDIDQEARKVPGTTKVRQMMVDTSLAYFRRLAADANGDPDLALEVGNAYMRAARVQGVPISANLGQMDQAEQNLRLAEGLIHSVLRSQPLNRTAMLRAAQITHDRMLIARLEDRDDEALVLAKQSAKWLEQYRSTDGDKAEATSILATYLNVADQHMLAWQFEDALELCQKGEQLARAFDRPAYLGTFLWVSAEASRRQGNLDQALNDIRESVRLLEPRSVNTDQNQVNNYVFALIKQGRILDDEDSISFGRSDEAAAILARAFEMSDRMVHSDPSNQATRGRLALAGLSLGRVIRNSDPRRALAIYDHTLQHMSEIKDNSSFRRYEVSALAASTYPLRKLGRENEARERMDSVFERLRKLKAFPADKIKPGSEPDLALRALADCEASSGNVRQAIDVYTKLAGQLLAWGPKVDTNLADAVDMSRVYASLAALHRRAGERDRASEMETRRRELWQHWEAVLPHNNFVRRQIGAVRAAAN